MPMLIALCGCPVGWGVTRPWGPASAETSGPTEISSGTGSLRLGDGLE